MRTHTALNTVRTPPNKTIVRTTTTTTQFNIASSTPAGAGAGSGAAKFHKPITGTTPCATPTTLKVTPNLTTTLNLVRTRTSRLTPNLHVSAGRQARSEQVQSGGPPANKWPVRPAQQQQVRAAVEAEARALVGRQVEVLRAVHGDRRRAGRRRLLLSRRLCGLRPALLQRPHARTAATSTGSRSTSRTAAATGNAYSSARARARCRRRRRPRWSPRRPSRRAAARSRSTRIRTSAAPA